MTSKAPGPIRSILVANRGEIAVRIIRACRELGIRAVAVYSEADAGAWWTRLADEAILIGPAPARLSYLDITALLDAAKAAGVDAVHPGYGLLSESAPFADAVRKAGLVFIGPRAETIALMGDKVTARAAAIQSGVPVLPGSDGAITDDDDALAIADELGWPVAVKANFGGGGRGMRVAATRDDLAEALAQAAREAAAAFGRPEVFLERYLERPRHVEVQVLGDCHGHVIHVGDRDCSVQRRHQKLLEEAPAPHLDPELRQRMHDCAVRLCRDVGYEGAGTVEFLVEAAGKEFFFLEMNTRLQVEHGVTELVSGIDLVRAQIAIAGGHPLAIAQDDVTIRGHAVQARITAEDPWQDFSASPGRIERLVTPQGPWVRCDFGVQGGDSVPLHYDSLFGKVQAWGSDRTQARHRLGVALDGLEVVGIPCSAPYLRSVLDLPAFAAATHDTGSLEREWSPAPDSRPISAPATDQAVPAAPRASRTIAIPWGGRSVELTVHGAVPKAGMAVPPRASRTGGRSGLTDAGGADAICAPMEGVVVALKCAPGQSVRKGEQVLLMEAMKMEVLIAAPRDGVIDEVFVNISDAVRTGGMLASLKAL